MITYSTEPCPENMTGWFVYKLGDKFTYISWFMIVHGNESEKKNTTQRIHNISIGHWFACWHPLAGAFAEEKTRVYENREKRIHIFEYRQQIINETISIRNKKNLSRAFYAVLKACMLTIGVWSYDGIDLINFLPSIYSIFFFLYSLRNDLQQII